jgi:hypothetical protein
MKKSFPSEKMGKLCQPACLKLNRRVEIVLPWMLYTDTITVCEDFLVANRICPADKNGDEKCKVELESGLTTLTGPESVNNPCAFVVVVGAPPFQFTVAPDTGSRLMLSITRPVILKP